MPATQQSNGSNQSSSPNCNCQSIRQAARQVTQLYDRHLAPTGLRTSQLSILVSLSRGGPQSINELATTLVMDRTTLGRGIKPLERDGLIAIGDGPDGRTKSLKLTAAGRKKMAQAILCWQEAQTEFETAFGVAESAALRATLERVVSIIPREE
jgi:DNA-binding MarR family transcriptional regulator